MTIRTTTRRGSFRAAGIAALAVLFLLTAVRHAAASVADANNLCDQPGEAPDIIVGDIGGDHIVSDVRRWGTIGGITAYSFAGTSCNIGTCWANWEQDDNTHPVIAQNMFELKDGRFAQIGQSWIKHSWGADTANYCGTCLPGDYSHMGVNCSDLYDTFGNGGQNRLGKKYAVDAYTGFYAFGPADISQTGNAIYKRLQVHNSDLDPANNPGAKYFVEMQYVSQDDAGANNGANNASYRPLTVSGDAATSVYNLALSGPTVVSQPAIMAWKAADPSVTITTANLPGDGKLYVGTKVTYRGGGVWRYEYAIQNLNASQAPVAMQVPIPAGSTVSSSSFHDVDYHSDDIQDNAPWTKATSSTAVTWKAATLVLNGLVPNALRWGTLYNFRIDVNAAPGTHAILLGYGVSPHPTFETSLTIPAATPSVCDNDGICDPGETCATCAADCAAQGGGSGCCGDGSCQAGETESACFADCGQPLASESLCGDGLDGDRDGQIDCFDTDCCADAACDSLDVDGDGLAVACDCNDANIGAWSAPSEVPVLYILKFSASGVLMNWSYPTEMGGAVVTYDVIRSPDAKNFDTTETCIAQADPGSPSGTDPEDPAPGGGFFYLVRAKNACPAVGPLGTSSTGAPHTAPACP